MPGITRVSGHTHDARYPKLAGGGAITGNLSVSGNLVTSTRAAIGAAASIQADRALDVNETRTDVTGANYGAHVTTTVAPSGALTGAMTVRPMRAYLEYASAVDGTGTNKAYLRGLNARVQTANTATGAPYELTGLYSDVAHQGAGNVTNMYSAYLGLQSRDTGNEAGNVTNMYGAAVVTTLTKNTGVVTNWYGFHAADPAGGGLLTNAYGMYVADITAGGTLNYGIYLAGTSGLARQGVWWNGDTNIYRSGPNVLATDDALSVALGAGFFGVTPPAARQTYTVTNALTDRAFDANATSIEELADVVGTLIADLGLWGMP